MPKSGTYTKTIESKKSFDTRYWFRDIHKDKVTFPTSCYWCRESVYFHRASNGGCVLFDELGYPWPVHSCWELHKSDRAHASKEMCERFKNTSLNIRPQIAKPFEGIKTISGCLLKTSDQIVFKSRNLSFVEFLIRDFNHNTYAVIVQKEFFDEIKLYSRLTITGLCGYVGNSYYLIPKNIAAQSPDENMFFIPSRVEFRAVKA